MSRKRGETTGKKRRRTGKKGENYEQNNGRIFVRSSCTSIQVTHEVLLTFGTFDIFESYAGRRSKELQRDQEQLGTLLSLLLPVFS
jgi:hypothetical protein